MEMELTSDILEAVCLVQQAVHIVLLEQVLLNYVLLVIIVQILNKKRFVPLVAIALREARQIRIVQLERIIQAQVEHQFHLVLPVQPDRIVL
jgi:hypothetical protein